MATIHPEADGADVALEKLIASMYIIPSSRGVLAETTAMDDDAMTSLLFEGQGRAISAATSARSEASTSPSSLNSMDQTAMRTLPNANKVLAFLHSSSDSASSAAKHGSLPVGFRLSHFIVLLNQLKAVLDQHLKLPNLVAKVAASRRLLSGLARVHHELNVLLVDNSLASATSSLLEWKQQFASNRLQDEKALHDTLMALLSTSTFVNKEFPSERRQALVLLELVAEFAANDPPEDILAKWTRVRHPNVVTVRGASHAATPPYLVRDFTTYGGLTSYLAALETRAKQCAGPESSGKMETLTWQLLYGASRGLLHLHEQHSIVHGGLRCNNILVDKKGRAVIADFGLYTLACDARDSGLTEYFQLDVFDADAEELIRWQAPECLREHVAYRESLRSLSETGSALVSSGSSASATSFATDVYAFGMCILEALTRTVPWAGLDIAKIRTLKGTWAWTLIEKMCAADPKQRITLSEASQELKRLGYGNRVFNRSRNSSSKDLEGLETDSVAKVDRVSNVLEEVAQKLQHLSSESRSRGSSATDLKTMEADAVAKVEHVSTSLGEVSQKLKVISDRSRNGSAADLGEIEEQASQKLVCVSSLLNIASQELKRLGMGDRASSESRNSSAQDLVAMAQEALAKLTLLSSEDPAEASEEAQSLIPDQSTSADNEPTVSPTAGPPVSPPSVRAKSVEELAAVTDLSAPSDASTVEQTGRRVKDSVSARRQRYSNPVVGGLYDPAVVHEEGSGNLWVSEEEAKATVPCSREVVRSLHGALVEEDSDNVDDKSTSTDDSAEASPAPEINSNRSTYEQPEQEMDSDTGSFKDAITEEDSAVLLSSDEEEGVTTVPAEFQTARSYDEDVDPASPLHAVIGLLESLRTEEPDEARFVETLVAMKEDLELSTAWTIVEREGLLTLMELNDEAKRQLWKCRGVGVMEDSLVIDRRLVQEVKSTMAKFKRSEGYKSLEDGEYHLAIDKFTEAIALDRKRAGYYGDRSLAYMEASMFKKAADDAYRCMRYNPYDVTGYLRHGVALKAMGKYKEAIASLRKGTEVDPKFTKIRDALAEAEKLHKTRLKGGDGATALRRMTAAESAKLKKKDGDDALRKKDFPLAIECYSEALELDPKNDWVYLHRSIAHAARGDHSKAIEDASRCIRINYRQVEGYYRLALALHAAGQHDQALSTCIADRKWTLDTREKGYRAFQLRSYEDAIKYYTKAIDASQSDDDDVVMHCYLYRSRANQTRGEFSAVIADCTYVLERRPKNVFARLRRADAYEQQRDFHMALKDIRELVALNPDYEDAHARLRSLEHRCRLLPGASEHKGVVEVDL
ncbi:Tetratricopeptide repeat [Phytophthora cactorum]|nr:Tetratricopeptide repeat [Phytophthora cactorum]